MSFRRHTLSLLIVLPLVVACTTTPPPRDDQDSRRGARTEGGGALGMLSLPASWWRDIHLTESLHLTADQVARLDALAPRHAQVSSLERDTLVAMREVRTALDAGDATSASVVAAGNHLRELRSSLLERQIALLGDQREVLTIDQWTLLQRELAEDLRPMRREGMRGRGGRGPGGRRGGERRPGGW